MIHDKRLEGKHIISPEVALEMTQLITRSKGSSFCDFEEEFLAFSRGDFSLFSQRNLTFKHSLDVKMDLEEEESNRLKD